MLVAGGLAFPDPTTKIELSHETFQPEAGHAYVIEALPSLPSGAGVGDDARDGRRSTISVYQDGEPLGPGHALHEDIRQKGLGRYSHWGAGLYFSTSDNTDPRVNGRRYAVGFAAPLPESLRWATLVLGVALLAFSQASGLKREWEACFKAVGGIRLLPVDGLRAMPWTCISLFLLAVTLVLHFGADRSGWILVTQPLELTHFSNSLLGYSFIQGGGLLHKENYSAFLQVGLFSGFGVEPDLYFRRPVYSFLASLLAPATGIAASLLLVNLAGWAMAAWLCHRFAMRFYEDATAARWAAAFAISGTGFVLHALDYSAHLLSFTFYFGGVVLIHESNVWRERAGARVHAIIAAYLALACLQYNTGIALVVAYLAVAIRHNPLRYVLPAALAAFSAQPLWGWIVLEIHQLQTGVMLADLSQTEREYLGRALLGWREILGQPAATIGSRLASVAGSFLAFESPLVVLVGAAFLVVDGIRSGAGRRRAGFAVPFIAAPLAAAMVFATAAAARGYLVFGISIFFFAACGAALAALRKRYRAAFLLAAGAMLATSLAWGMAHYANVLGPAKAYFLGFNHLPWDLFVPGTWESVSLTGAESTPKAFGGHSSLGDAGLATTLPIASSPLHLGARYALMASAFLVALCGVLFALCMGRAYRVALILSGVLLAVPVMAGRTVDDFAPVANPERIYRVEVPLTYSIDLSAAVRERLLAGALTGQVAMLFAAQTGGEAPVVRVGGQRIRLDRKVAAADWFVDSGKVNTATWVLNAQDLRSALEGQGAVALALEFPAGKDAYLSGWQRAGLPGRTIESANKERPSVLPSVELRLFRSDERGAPVLIAF